MIIPFGKLEMFNCINIAINTFYIFEKKGFPSRHIYLILCLIGIYFILFKKGNYTIIGFTLTYFWLFHKIDYENLTSSIIVSLSLITYLLISGYTLFKIIKN